MTPQFVIAWYSEKGFDAKSGVARGKRLLTSWGIPADEIKCSVSHSENGVIGLVTFLRDNEDGLRVPINEVTDDYHSASCFLSEQISDEGNWVGNTIKKASKDDFFYESLAPPTLLFHHHKRKGEIDIINDWRGCSKLYEFECEGVYFWSNRISMLSIFSGISLESSDSGWATTAALNWNVGNQTVFKNISVVAPGSKVCLRSHPDRVFRKSLGSMKERLTKVEGHKGLLKDTYRSLGHLMSKIDQWGLPALKIGLSGGRDSRIVAASALKFGVNADYHTAPSELDLYLAKELIKKSNSSFPWKEISRPNTTHENAYTSSLLERSDYGFLSSDGDAPPTLSYYEPSALDNQFNWAKSYSLSGVGGELAHPNFYTQKHLDNIQFSEFIPKWISGMCNNVSFLSDLPKIRAEKHVFEVILDAYTNGVGEYSALDWFYIWSLGRMANGRNFQTICPLMTTSYAVAGFKQTNQAKINSDFQRKLIRKLKKEWLEVPFSHEQLQDPTNTLSGDGSMYRMFWEGEDRDEFFDLIRTHDCYEGLYDRKAVLKGFEDVSRETPSYMRFQKCALGILWRISADNYINQLNHLM